MSRFFPLIAVCGFLSLLVPISIATFEEHAEPEWSEPAAAANRDTIRTDFSDYIWPTDAGRIVTSTFGEFRRMHFHGGMDVSTGNTTGYKVFAARDGYVARIRISPHGYGKMLYVRHYDGYYTTYAHLEHFNAEIDARVLREQLRLERYPVEIDCEPGEFTVKKGDIIAYTGETGVGSPHLHFEIRDEMLEMVNPFLCDNITIQDASPPTIRRVAITPLSDSTWIDGKWDQRVYTVKTAGPRSFRVQETVRATGNLGFAIDVRDRSSGSRFRHGVYSNELYIDDSLVYAVKLDRVPAREAHQIGLYYDWRLLDEGRGRFERLYTNSPNDLPFYTPKGTPSGIVTTSAYANGPHEFRIVSTDFNNNSSEVTGRIIFNHQPAFELERTDTELRVKFEDIRKVKTLLVYRKNAGSETWSLKTFSPEPAIDNTLHIPLLTVEQFDILKIVARSQWETESLPQFYFFKKPTEPANSGTVQLAYDIEEDFVRVHVRTNRTFTEPPAVIVYEGGNRRSVATTALDIDSYTGSFRPLESFGGTRRLVAVAEVDGSEAHANAEFDLYPIVAGASGTILYAGDSLRLTYNPQSVFKSMFVRISRNNDAEEPGYVLQPDRTVLRGAIEVTLRAEASGPKRGLGVRGSGRWELLARTDTISAGRITGRITKTLGEVSVFTDEMGPYVSNISVTRASTRRPRITFRYGDNIAGVEYNELKMYIDSVLVIPEIDGEHRRVSHQVTDPLAPGSHQLTIRLKDRLGNASTFERPFTVR